MANIGSLKTKQNGELKFDKSADSGAVTNESPILVADEQNDVITNEQWKERLFNINKKTVKLEYLDETEPQADSANVIKSKDISTTNYKLEPENIELGEGIFVNPLSSGGMVSDKEEGAGVNSVVFFSPGGKMKVQPSNLGDVKEQEAELAMLHVIGVDNTASEKSESESQGRKEVDGLAISAYLREPIVFTLQNGYKIELNQGEYVKQDGGVGLMKFWDTKISYEKDVLANNITVEMDDTGVIKPSDKTQLGEVREVFSSTVIKDEELKVEFDFADEKWLKYGYVMEIGETKVYLKEPERDGDKVSAPFAVVDFYGFIIELENVNAKNHDYIIAGKGNAVFEGYNVSMSDIRLEEKKSKTLQIGSTETQVEGLIKIVNNMANSQGTTESAQGDKKSKDKEEKLLTRDGFAKIDASEFKLTKGEKDGGKVSGKGTLELLEIPYTLNFKDGTQMSDKVTGKEKVEDVVFNVDNSGKLNAEFEEGAKALLQLGGKDSSSDAIFLITLEKLSIDDGYLKAGSVRLDRGVSITQKKLFECKMSGTVANESTKADIGSEGINADMEKTTFGTYKVEELLGFLSGEVDYPKGSLSVSAEKKAETEKPEEGYFGINKDKAAISAYILTGIPGLQIKFKFVPSASIGGKIGVTAQRGEPFDAPWEGEKSGLELSGSIEAEGEAALGAEAGVELGVPVLANVDMMLGGKLSATLGGKLEGNTKLKYNKEEEKLKQSDNFGFKGSVAGEIKGNVYLNSNLNFLFWNMKLYETELLKKELGKVEFKVAGSKDYKKKGLTEGWNLESEDLTVELFSKEIIKKHKDGKTLQEKTVSNEELKELVANSSKETEEAWAVLCELKRKRSGTLIILEEEDKQALDDQITTATNEVTNKIKNYLSLLEASQKALETETTENQNKLASLIIQLDTAENKMGVSKEVFENARLGGYDKTRYKKKENPNGSKEEKNNIESDKMAAIDLMIAHMLGEVSKEKLDEIARRYDEKNKGHFIFSKTKFKDKTEEAKTDIYRAATVFVNTGYGIYDDQSSYYTIMKKEVLFDEKKRRGSGEYNANKLVRIARTKWDFPAPFREIVVDNPNMTMEELLKCALDNKKPDGSELNATAKQKWQLLHDAFGIAEKISLDDRIFDDRRTNAAKIIKDALAKSVGDKFADMFSTSLDDVIKGVSVIDIFKKIDDIKDKIVQTKEDIVSTQKVLKNMKLSIDEVTAKQAEYHEKLAILQRSSNLALVKDNFSADAAEKVIDIYSNEYVDKMKGNKEVLESKNSKENLKWMKNNKDKIKEQIKLAKDVRI